jgi:hypothetical protein
MIIKLEKFGKILLFRENGKKAFLDIQPILKKLKENENIEIDFTGVTTFTPSWGDEFLTPLSKTYGERLILGDSTNPSVLAVLGILEEIAGKAFHKIH